MRAFTLTPVRLSLVCLLVVGVLPAACKTAAATVDLDVMKQIKASPTGSFLSGPMVGLGAPTVVNRRDFVYALAFSPQSNALAFVHHVSTNMEMTYTEIEPLAARFQQPINTSEFDIEDAAFLRRSGQAQGALLVPSRQGVARAFDEVTGKFLYDHTVGVPLVRLAVSPHSDLVAVGTADGRVLLLDPATFTRKAEAQPFTDEVRGLAFASDGRIIAASFDGSLAVIDIATGSEPVTRVPSGVLKGGQRVFLSFLGDAGVVGARGISTVKDSRQPSTCISGAAVKRLKLPPVEGALPVSTMNGVTDFPIVDLGNLTVGVLTLGNVHAAVSDECVPVGAELTIGADTLARAVFTDDIAKDEVVVRPSDAADHATLVPGALSMQIAKKIALPGPATDLDVSRNGVVVVSFSQDKAVRSFDLYDAEKSGSYPEPSLKSGAAIVDVEAGTLGHTLMGHHGYTVAVAVSPDGATVATGGWDKRLLVFDVKTGAVVTERELSWLVRRVRFAPDGHLLGVAAWTPVNVMNEGDSDPALLLYPVVLDHARIVPAGT